MSASFQISVLARQRMLFKERFAERYAHPWLIWELGSFSAGTGGKQDLVDTAMPQEGETQRPSLSDPICFPLTRPSTIVGRGDGADIVIPDATVSRHHALLRHADGAWQVQPIIPQAEVVVGGATLQLGAPRTLRSGDRICLMRVELVFLEPDELTRRLDDLSRTWA